MPKTARRYPSFTLVSLLLALPLAWSPVAAQDLERQGTFEGKWTLEGRLGTMDVDGHEVQVMRVEGPVTVETTGGLRTAFESDCVGVADGEAGGTGRCIWTDADGDAITMDMEGRIIGPAGTFREAKGVITGGTGKYAKLEGEYQLDWLFIESSIEPGKVLGRGTKLEGTWRIRQ